jgi:hypothetical protein
VSAKDQIGWYLRRLMRMSPPEIAHRVIEQTKRAADARRKWSWSDFGNFDGPLHGLPGTVSSRVEVLRPEIEAEVLRIRGRRFRLLNQDWPSTSDWDSVWHLDPVTGSNWPGAETFAFQSSYRRVPDKGDVKFVWEVNRLQFLPTFALAKEVGLLSEILESWMAQNPPFQGINWTSGIEAASRVVSVLAAFAFLDREAQLRLDARVRSFLGAHLFWIQRYPSLYSSANNHRVAELVGIFLSAICMPGAPNAPKLIAEMRESLEDRMQHLFHPDGVGAEQSVTYAAYALEWFALAGVAADATNVSFDVGYKGRAAKAADWLRWLMDDDGGTPAIGDGDETRVLAIRQEPEVRYAASVVGLVTRWLDAPDLSSPTQDANLRDLWGAAESEPARALPLGTRVFEDGGYTVFREATAHGHLVCIFDHGPLGFESIAAHGHADALSVWLSWGDEPIFVDAGTYLYHSGGEWRDRFRSTAVHNTLTIGDEDQSKIAGPFNWSHHAHAQIVARSSMSIAAEHDGYAAPFGLFHHRTVSLDRLGGIVIEDAVVGNSRATGFAWAVGFTLAPGIKASIAGNGFSISTPKKRMLTIAVEQGRADMRVGGTPVSPAFNHKIESNRLMLCGTVKAVPSALTKLRIEIADG